MKAIFVFLILISCEFNLFAQEIQTGFTDAEYKFISNILTVSKDSTLVIKNPTIPTRIVEKDFDGSRDIGGIRLISKSYLTKAFPNLSDEIIDDFNSKNDKAYELQKKITISGKYEFVSETEMSKIFYESKDADDFQAEINNFRKKFPNSFGFIQFSRIGFNKQKTQAIIYETNWCGSVCGEGKYVFYIKQNEKWVKNNELPLWVS